MKKNKILLLLVILLFIVGCGEQRNNRQEEDDKPIMSISTNNDEETETQEEGKDSQENKNNKKSEGNNDTSTSTKNYLPYGSYDNKVIIKVPNTWKLITKKDLNADAILELTGRNEDKFLMIISDSKEEFSSYSKWQDLAIESEAKAYGYDKNVAKKVTINGYEGKYVEFVSKEDSYKIYMKIYFLKVGDNYLQVFFWTNESNKGEYSKEFDSIIATIEDAGK